MSAATEAQAVRAGAGVFRMDSRGLVRVRGTDRVRWLDGMLSNHVEPLAPGPDSSGCYALLLTPKGRIVADPRVLCPDAETLLLELARDAVAPTQERLERYVIADDVTLEDASQEFSRLGVEGPRARAVLAAAVEGGAPPLLAADSCAWIVVAGRACLAAAFGFSGEEAFQLFAPADSGAAVAAALEAGGAVPATAAALEILRVEAGIPLLGADLDEEVFPYEAHLDRAISTEKGCYTGQEIVARLRSRGQVNHLLVGLESADGEPLAVDTELHAGDKRVGEVTSACVSPAAGAIALGFVRREVAMPGTELRAGNGAARVASLPFVAPGSSIERHEQERGSE